MYKKIIALLFTCLLMRNSHTMQQMILKENEYADQVRASKYIEKAYNQLQKKQFLITNLWLNRALACKNVSPELSAQLHLLRATYFMSLERVESKTATTEKQSKIAQELLKSLQYAIATTTDQELRTCAELRLAAVYCDGVWGVTRDFAKVVTILQPLLKKLSNKSALDKQRKSSIYATLALVYEHGGYGIEKNTMRALSYIFEATKTVPS